MNFYHNTRCTTAILSGRASDEYRLLDRKLPLFCHDWQAGFAAQNAWTEHPSGQEGDNALCLAALVRNVSTMATCSGAEGEESGL
jgi:hypothetical protein